MIVRRNSWGIDSWDCGNNKNKDPPYLTYNANVVSNQSHKKPEKAKQEKNTVIGYLNK
jgi:hypothetical protein